MNQQSTDRLVEIGRQGGSVDTNGMTSTQKQQTDAAVNKGKSEAGR